jgi:hypothetical protein
MSYHGPTKGLAAERRIISLLAAAIATRGAGAAFMRNPYRNKTVITFLATFFVFLCAGGLAFASGPASGGTLSYRTQLEADLDGDQLPETATIRQNGYHYQISIHFSTGRPKLRLTTYLSEGIAGLSLETTDLNADGRNELVIHSATSIRPIAIWLNQGRAKFKKVSLWTFRIGRHAGPEYHHRKTGHPEPEGNISVDPLPQATLGGSYFIVEDVGVLLCVEAEKRPADSLLWDVHPRGPPAAPRV